ncbi:glucose 1-dehydrogenase [Bradyrhizobium prioriisuperbiae]|uniref:SDR family NAD(P)-dependent oxidoreductase n=1 Tax=Bradyrhizobium prioriisuperbiae TaxID=2854389 RepID=UPI0028E43217|nr:glucose 1-dehydrogenase [Bradyrhizobium prioritasuperba]
MSFDGKVALVTGASRGIGAAVARTLAGRGANVAITYKENRRSAETLSLAICDGGGTATTFQVSIEDSDSVQQLIANVVESYGRIDILVNNAGVAGARAFSEIDFSFYAQQFHTNVWGTIQVTQAAVPHFPVSGGRIVNLSSQRAFSPRDGMGVYAASKAAVSTLTQAMAIELGPRNITVNAVAPAVTETDMTAKMPAEKKAAFAALTPLKRLAVPQDVADVIAFLASDEARWITGRTILADGGLT